MSFRLTREQLYDLVWSEAMRALSQKIGISDVAIAKHCRNHGVPVPERGYWNKLQAGQHVTKAELPQRDLGTTYIIEMSGTLPAELRARFRGEPGVTTDAHDDIGVLEGRFRKRLGKVAVPRTLDRPHPSIAKLLAKDEERRSKYPAGPLSSYFGARFDSPFERRRLRFLNGLFLGFAKVGGKSEIRGDRAREVTVYLGHTTVSFELEMAKQPRHGRQQSKKQEQLDDRMYLSIQTHRVPSVPTRWEDEAGAPLEVRLTDIIAGMAVAGEHLYRIAAVEHTAWKRKLQEDEERRKREWREVEEKRERERLAAIAKAKRDGLLSDAHAWQNAELIQHYVAAVLASGRQPENSGSLNDWSAWALAELTRLIL